jgi:hypothetical protein
VYSVSGQMMIDEVGSLDGGDPGGALVNNNNPNSLNNPIIQTILAQNNAIRIQNQELLQMVKANHEQSTMQIRVVKKVINRFISRPTHITRPTLATANNITTTTTANNNINNNDIINTNTNNNIIVNDNENNIININNYQIQQPSEYNYLTSLSPKPKDIYQLWEEYEFGIGGRKAAKLFNTAQRGKNKYKYHRRKVIWDKIIQLIRRGHTYHTAIDEIYRVYGVESTVTEIINKMRVDRGRGGHPQL